MSTATSPARDPGFTPAAAATAVSASPRGAKTALRMGAALVLFDLASLTMAVSGSFLLWRMVNPTIPPFRSVILLLPLCCLAQFALSGQYPGIGLTAVEHLRRICHDVTVIYLLFTAAMFLAKRSSTDSRGALTLAWAGSLLLVPVGRWLATHLFMRRSWWGIPVVVIGEGESGGAVIRALLSNQILGYRPIACLVDEPGRDGYCEGVPILGGLGDAAVAKMLKINHAVVSLPRTRPEHLLCHMRRWRQLFPRILLVPELVGIATLWTQPRDLGGIFALEMRQNLLNPWNQRIKRAADIALASFALVLAAPLLAICALWIRKASPGNPFYTQEREGKDGHPLRVFKLRTMFPEAEGMLQHHLANDPEAREEWERFCKLKHDPRILPGVGTFLRKTSLDELPQLWNVLKGEMSLVGPRPFPEYHNSRFDPEFHQFRTQVTPGLTGLWQVSARSDGDLDTQQRLDGYYIRNWSLWLDLYILARTARALIVRDGAY